MQNFEFLQQPLLGELAMSWREREKRERREKNAMYSGHLRLCQQPRAAHALRSDQKSTCLSLVVIPTQNSVNICSPSSCVGKVHTEVMGFFYA